MNAMSPTPIPTSVAPGATPFLAPAEASLYLNKVECFCFNQQPLTAGANTKMPMQFYVDPDIPEHITTFTLSYTLYDVTAQSSQSLKDEQKETE